MRLSSGVCRSSHSVRSLDSEDEHIWRVDEEGSRVMYNRSLEIMDGPV